MKTTKNLSTWLIADLLQCNTPGGHRQYGGFTHVHRVTQVIEQYEQRQGGLVELA